MKKNDNPNSLRRFKLWRKLLIVKLLCVCLFLQNTALSASVYSQELKLTLKGNDISLTNIFSQIRESSDYTFVYNLDDIQDVRVKSLDVKDASIREVLDKCLKGTGFSYEIEDHVVIIRPDRPAKQEVKKVTLSGLVMDQGFRADSGSNCPVKRYLRGSYDRYFREFSNDNTRTEGDIPAILVRGDGNARGEGDGREETVAGGNEREGWTIG